MKDGKLPEASRELVKCIVANLERELTREESIIEFYEKHIPKEEKKLKEAIEDRKPEEDIEFLKKKLRAWTKGKQYVLAKKRNIEQELKEKKAALGE